MKKENQKVRLLKEEEKIRQVTHWDLDYLSKDEILDLYKRETGSHNPNNGIIHTTDNTNKTAMSNRNVALLLIAIGLMLLTGALYVASLL